MNWFRKKQPVANVPYVTGLMATRRKDRHPFAQLAIDSFLAQDWPHLQVVVYNGTSASFKRDKRVREINLRPMEVHEMRNIALHNADGMYCALLQDDCYYAPSYLPGMMKGIGLENLHLLASKEIYSVTHSRAHLVDDDRVLCPVWRRNYPVRFTANEADFVSAFYNVVRVQLAADSVTKFVS